MAFLTDTRSCRKLYFLRHGLAGQHGDPKYKDDSLRPLTREGRQKLRLAGLGMKKAGLTFDAILSSPYVRARQTAEIICGVYRLKNSSIHFTNNLLPPAPAEKLLKEIRADCLQAQYILAVGHEPHLTQMISKLLKSPRPLAVDFKKGGLCCLALDGWSSRNAALNWLLTPSQLALMSK